MKYLFGVALIGFIIAVAYLAVANNSNKAATDQGNGKIILKNVPPLVCPERAEVVVTKLGSNSPVLDSVAAVESCQFINLLASQTLPEGEYQLSIKLPKALALSAQFISPLQHSLEVPLLLGDANDDNIIDQLDQSLVAEAMFNSGGAADLNSDKQVSIEDYLLTKLNEGVGIERPDGRGWQVLK